MCRDGAAHLGLLHPSSGEVPSFLARAWQSASLSTQPPDTADDATMGRIASSRPTAADPRASTLEQPARDMLSGIENGDRGEIGGAGGGGRVCFHPLYIYDFFYILLLHEFVLVFLTPHACAAFQTLPFYPMETRSRTFQRYLSSLRRGQLFLAAVEHFRGVSSEIPGSLSC